MIELSFQGVPIRRMHSDGREELMDDAVALDMPVCLFVNNEPYRTLVASPIMLEELALGHLYTEGVITALEDVVEMSLVPGRVEITLNKQINSMDIQMANYRLITTACGESSSYSPRLQKVSPGVGFDSSTIRALVKSLNEMSSVFKATGGTHSAILHSESFEAFAEDVGRHNALDKVIGAGLMSSIDFGRCILGSSGRLAGEMVLKAARAGIPIVFSISAPLLSGIRVAEEAGITLVGFVRGTRMNLYTW